MAGAWAIELSSGNVWVDRQPGREKRNGIGSRGGSATEAMTKGKADWSGRATGRMDPSFLPFTFLCKSRFTPRTRDCVSFVCCVSFQTHPRTWMPRINKY